MGDGAELPGELLQCSGLMSLILISSTKIRAANSSNKFLTSLKSKWFGE